LSRLIDYSRVGNAYRIFLGPFVNDAINDITKKKAEETTAYSDVHFSIQQEREADVVSLR
jgi:hypothetical protein